MPVFSALSANARPPWESQEGCEGYFKLEIIVIPPIH